MSLVTPFLGFVVGAEFTCNGREARRDRRGQVTARRLLGIYRHPTAGCFGRATPARMTARTFVLADGVAAADGRDRSAGWPS